FQAVTWAPFLRRRAAMENPMRPVPIQPILCFRRSAIGSPCAIDCRKKVIMDPMRRVTLRDVARRAGVHPSTASRALNPRTPELITEAIARRVSRTAQALGYRPDPIAYGLKTNRSRIIGVLIPDITNPVFPPIIRA